MRDLSQDDDEASGWLRVEFALVVLVQIAGLVALLGWLLS